jgi:peptidoglycan hydrolase-like protein with peptidoglycan-binding domain
LFCFAPAYGVVAKKKAKSSSTKTTSRKAAPKKGTATASRKGTPARKGAQTTTASRRRTTQRAQSAPTPERYKEIQQALADKGFYKGEVNGQWGPDSVQALKQFQEDQKLLVDGKIGALSLIALGLGPRRQAVNEAVVTTPQKTNP